MIYICISQGPYQRNLGHLSKQADNLYKGGSQHGDVAASFLSILFSCFFRASMFYSFWDVIKINTVNSFVKKKNKLFVFLAY